MPLDALGVGMPYSSAGAQTIAQQEEATKFKQLQQSFTAQFEAIFPNRHAAKTVIIVPSLSLDAEILQKIKGVHYYEERLLCLLMLLRMPRTHVVYVTSLPVDPVIIDYYLHLLPGITGYHARQRVQFFSCYDASKQSLTGKILQRPRLIERIRQCIPAGHSTHMACFNVSDEERKLAVALGVPIYGCDPDLQYLGSKSSSRKIFKSIGLQTPSGFEDLASKEDIVQALVALKQQKPALQRAVVKINDGFSGEGNAIFSYQGAPPAEKLKLWVGEVLPANLKIVADKVGFDDYMLKFGLLGGIVEEFIEGAIKTTPSVQCRVTPLGKAEVISTHDQITGGESGQVFIGATFPANKAYATAIGTMGLQITERLKELGVLGRFSIDFVSVWDNNKWQHYAIELNLRKGGTTHPYLMLQFLTGGAYNAAAGKYMTANGLERCYICSDNFESEQYKGLTPHDLIDIASCHELMYNGTSQEGVMFHLISALSQYGKMGVVCIGATPERAAYFFHQTKAVLDKAAEATNHPG